MRSLFSAALVLALCVAISAPPAHADDALALKPYKPAYMSYTSIDGESAVRFRLSTEVPLLREAFQLPYFPDLLPVVAYTQESTVLPDSSFRFEHTNHNPEIRAQADFGRWYLDRLGIGYEHISSGEDGGESNGLDMAIFEPAWTLQVSDSIAVDLWVRLAYLIGTEPNTDGLRDLVTMAGRDFFPRAGATIRTPGGEYAVEFTRDNFDAEVLLSLVAGWNFQVYGQYHQGPLLHIGDWATDAKAVGAGLAFGW